MQMKRSILSFLFALGLALPSMAQQKIGSFPTAIQPTAVMELESTTKGFLPPRLTNAQRNAILNPAKGLVIYNKTVDCLQWCDGVFWFDACGRVYVGAPEVAAGSGSLTGRNCFDIAESNDNVNECGLVSTRALTRSNFNLASTNTQTYTFTPSGTVSNVRFYFVNTNGAVIQSISGNNAGNNISTAQIATVHFNPDLSSDDPNAPSAPLGLANSATRTTDLKAKIYAAYNINAVNSENPADDRVVELSISVKDCDCCGAFVSNTVWKAFLCHNLGADYTLDPHDVTQANAWGLQGAYLQWGKRGPNTTGDSRIDWRTAANDGPGAFAAAPTASDPNTGTITGWNTTVNAGTTAWNSGTEASPVKTANDPCPPGYRMPTRSEWDSVKANNVQSKTGLPWVAGSTNYGAALHFGPNVSTKSLTLPTAGFYSTTWNVLAYRGFWGAYWSSTEHTDPNRAYSPILEDSVTSMHANSMKRAGHSIRCIDE